MLNIARRPRTYLDYVHDIECKTGSILKIRNRRKTNGFLQDCQNQVGSVRDRILRVRIDWSSKGHVCIELMHTAGFIETTSSSELYNEISIPILEFSVTPNDGQHRDMAVETSRIDITHWKWLLMGLFPKGI